MRETQVSHMQIVFFFFLSDYLFNSVISSSRIHEWHFRKALFEKQDWELKMLRLFISVCMYVIFIQMLIICDTVCAEIPLMRFSFEEQEIDIGTIFDVDVRMTQPDKELSSYSYSLLFNHQVLKIIEITDGIYGRINDANASGTINIADYRSQWEIIDSQLLLTRITFQVIGDYCSVSELTLSHVSLYDVNIESMDVENQSSGVHVICPKAQLIGVPEGTVYDDTAQMQVTGTGLTHYKYSLDELDYSNEISINIPILLENLTEGTHCIKVLGKIASVWQAEQEATKACWYIFMPRPNVQLITPIYGPDTGNTQVTIDGLHFHSDCMVFFGENEAEILTIANNQIVCLTPEHASKTVGVTLENPYKKTTILNRAFSYYPQDSHHQILFTKQTDTKIAPGAKISWQINYTTSDQNQRLPGLGVRMHYNSNLLSWEGMRDIYDNDMLSGRDLNPKKDSGNLDNDPNTDKCVQVAWMDISRNWSGQQLPHTLFNMSFSTSADVGINSESAIHFTATSHATTHQFFAPSISINFQPWIIDCTAQGSGHISPSSLIEVGHNNTQKVQFIADRHYHIESVYIDGESQGQLSEYTFENVDANHLVTVMYAIDRVNLTLEKRGTGTGMIKPFEGTYTYDYDTGIILTALASESSIFTGWSGDATGSSNMSIIMDRDKHIYANFEIKKFLITPISDEHGRIDPADPFYIEYNDSKVVKIYPDRCYEIENVWVNDDPRGSVFSHNFIDVRSDQTIRVEFRIKDKDSDGLPDCTEVITGCTDFDNPDSDEDGLLDGEEDRNQDGMVDIDETSPCEPDSDYDGMADGWELTHGMNPLLDDAMSDKDADGYANYYEYINQLDPEAQDYPYQLHYRPDTDNRQPYQMINIQPDYLKIVPGGRFDLEIIYNATDNNPHSKGIGLQIFFSSDDINWESFQALLTNGLKTEVPQLQTDDNNFDNEPMTDRYISVLWQDENSLWPDTVLPQKLCTATFSVNADMPENYSGYIRIQSFFLDERYHFYASTTQYQAQRGNLDIDGNGIEDALTDGLLIMGYLYGFRSTPLVNNAIGPYAVRTTPEQIEPILKGMYGLFDIDGNGIVNALADGLLLVRYLFGFRDYELVFNLITPNCTRCNAEEIVEYIRQIKPNGDIEE